jgi:drug/metabolite transporter (DMT)-like permease
MVGKTSAGIIFATTTAVIWGGQFVVGKTALARVDALPLTAARYAVAAVVLLALLAAVEGRAALRLDGRGLRLFCLGSLGFAGFNLLAYTGLEHARPQSASLIVALGPLVTALVLWLQRGIRPPRSTGAAIVVALAGVALVVSKGDPASIVQGSVGWGDALVLAGVTSFTFYTVGAGDYPRLSPLRFTALTAGLGWLTIAGVSAVAMAAGAVATPSVSDLHAVVPELLYLALPGAVVAVLTWNAAVVRIGAQNVTLIGNLIPVTTFTIEIVRGYRPNALELTGAAIALGALAANNLLLRRSARVSAPERSRENYESELEAA